MIFPSSMVADNIGHHDDINRYRNVYTYMALVHRRRVYGVRMEHVRYTVGGKIHSNRVYTCTPKMLVRTLLAGVRGGARDSAYGRGGLESRPIRPTAANDYIWSKWFIGGFSPLRQSTTRGGVRSLLRLGLISHVELDKLLQLNNIIEDVCPCSFHFWFAYLEFAALQK